MNGFRTGSKRCSHLPPAVKEQGCIEIIKAALQAIRLGTQPLGGSGADRTIFLVIGKRGTKRITSIRSDVKMTSGITLLG